MDEMDSAHSSTTGYKNSKNIGGRRGDLYYQSTFGDAWQHRK